MPETTPRSKEEFALFLWFYTPTLPCRDIWEVLILGDAFGYDENLPKKIREFKRRFDEYPTILKIVDSEYGKAAQKTTQEKIFLQKIRKTFKAQILPNCGNPSPNEKGY